MVAKITKKSNSLDLNPGVFTLNSAKKSKRRKAKTIYQSAMSMLCFYINRAGKNLSDKRKNIL
jgi:hypothetical protein